MRLSTPLLLAAALTGCASVSPETDAAFGNAVRQAKTLQTLDPQAGLDDPTLPSLDAASARNALARQRESFKEPPSTFQILGVGGLAPGGAAK